MIKIAVCEDEKIIQEQVIQLLRAFEEANNLCFEIDAYCHGTAMLSSQHHYDIYLLDIEMPGLNGIEVAKKIRQADLQCHIIFVSSREDKVFEAFDVQALHFIRKPIQVADFDRVICRATKACEVESDQALVFEITQKKHMKLPLKAIMYIETHGRKTKIHTQDETFISNDKISTLEDRISTVHFFKPHASFIVNLNYVKAYHKGEVHLLNSQIVPLSRLKEREFKKAFHAFIRMSGMSEG